MTAQEGRLRLELTLTSIGYSVGSLLILVPLGLLGDWYGRQVAPSLLVGGLIGLSLMLYPTSARFLTELNSLPQMRERVGLLLERRSRWLLISATLPSFLVLLIWWNMAEPAATAPGVVPHVFGLFVAALHIIHFMLAAQHVDGLWRLQRNRRLE